MWVQPTGEISGWDLRKGTSYYHAYYCPKWELEGEADNGFKLAQVQVVNLQHLLLCCLTTAQYPPGVCQCGHRSHCQQSRWQWQDPAMKSCLSRSPRASRCPAFRSLRTSLAQAASEVTVSRLPTGDQCGGTLRPSEHSLVRLHYWHILGPERIVTIQTLDLCASDGACHHRHMPSLAVPVGPRGLSGRLPSHGGVRFCGSGHGTGRIVAAEMNPAFGWRGRSKT